MIPDSLLVHPCDVTDAGSTPRTLAKAYVANNSCIGDYKVLVEKQKSWKKAQVELYKPKDGE